MLTANRFDEIKTFTASLHGTKVADLALSDVAKMAVMLAELAAEIERLRTPAQTNQRSHLKPVVLDAQGKPVAPPPLHQQFAAERREQYDADRFEAIMALQTADPVGPWKRFSLRWGLAPPPGGWDNFEAIFNVIHSVRIVVKDVPYVEKHWSASYLTSKGIKLPPGVTLINGELRGVELPD